MRCGGWTAWIATIVRRIDIELRTTPSNLAMSIGKIDRALPSIKTNAVSRLTRKYKTKIQALQSISRHPCGRSIRPDERGCGSVIERARDLSDNFFPEMKADWRRIPTTSATRIGPVVSAVTMASTRPWPDRTRKANDCNACHTILAQGNGEELNLISPNGQKFKHPGDEVDGACNDCHTGGL